MIADGRPRRRHRPARAATSLPTYVLRDASLKDPAGLFNSSLEGATRRAIDFREGDVVDERALKALIREAVKRNASRA